MTATLLGHWSIDRRIRWGRAISPTNRGRYRQVFIIDVFVGWSAYIYCEKKSLSTLLKKETGIKEWVNYVNYRKHTRREARVLTIACEWFSYQDGCNYVQRSCSSVVSVISENKVFVWKQWMYTCVSVWNIADIWS